MRYLFLAFIVCQFLLGSSVFAQTSEFNIRVLAGDDTVSPSTPTLLSAVPIAPTQIDVAWSTSTDNWIFGGYVLFRDGSPIATTTQTTYSDTGLAPETTYAYTVYAFDSAGNLSGLSNEISTTTTAVPVVATSTPSATPATQITSTLTLVLQEFSVVPSETSAAIMWRTNVPSRFTLRWGRTDTYSDGYISNETYAASQITTIQGLEPGTVYRYELIGLSPAGISVVLKRGQFTTTSQTYGRVVANVERLTAEVVESDVVLQYTFPPLENGARVRIVRSHLGFPADLYDGAIIYEGTDTVVRDIGALSVYGTQYYTVFVIGSDGTVSSGAVVLARRRGDGAVLPGDSGSGLGSSATTSVPSEFTEPEILLSLLEQNDIVISQQGRVYTFISERIELSPHEPFTISIAKDAVPNHLKSIIVTLLDPTDQRRSYSFLLRINKDGLAYEATIAPLQVFGASRLQIEIYDFDALVVGRYRTQLNFVPGLEQEKPVVFPDAFIGPIKLITPFVLGMGLIIFLLWLFLWWRRRSPEDKT